MKTRQIFATIAILLSFIFPAALAAAPDTYPDWADAVAHKLTLEGAPQFKGNFISIGQKGYLVGNNQGQLQLYTANKNGNSWGPFQIVSGLEDFHTFGIAVEGSKIYLILNDYPFGGTTMLKECSMIDDAVISCPTTLTTGGKVRTYLGLDLSGGQLYQTGAPGILSYFNVGSWSETTSVSIYDEGGDVLANDFAGVAGLHHEFLIFSWGGENAVAYWSFTEERYELLEESLGWSGINPCSSNTGVTIDRGTGVVYTTCNDQEVYEILPVEDTICLGTADTYEDCCVETCVGPGCGTHACVPPTTTTTTTTSTSTTTSTTTTTKETTTTTSTSTTTTTSSTTTTKETTTTSSTTTTKETTTTTSTSTTTTTSSTTTTKETTTTSSTTTTKETTTTTSTSTTTTTSSTTTTKETTTTTSTTTSTDPGTTTTVAPTTSTSTTTTTVPPDDDDDDIADDDIVDDDDDDGTDDDTVPPPSDDDDDDTRGDDDDNSGGCG